MTTDDVYVPKYDELFWPTLEAIKRLGGSASIAEITEKVSEIEGLTEDQQTLLHVNGRQTVLEYRLAWARTYLKAVGALENSARGVWSITETGRSLTPEDTKHIRARVRAEGRKRKRTDTSGLEIGEPGDSEEGRGWKEQLLETILQISPDAFERLSQRLLRESGFVNVTVTGRTGDGGIDGTGVYRVSLVSFPVFFQCKRWRGSISASTVRDFRGAMAGRGDKGILFTTAGFTSEAMKEATRDGAPPIDLVDGDYLCDLLKKHGLGVTSTERVIEEVTIHPEFFEHL